MSTSYDGAVKGTDHTRQVTPLNREGRLAGEGRRRKPLKRGEKGKRERHDKSKVGGGSGEGASLDVRA